MKRLILPLASAALLLTLAFLCLLAWPRYQQYRQARALRQARAFMLAGDFPNASLSARQVLQAAPRNLEACSIMADLAEACRSPAALDWQQRVAEISPTVANRLKLASDVLRFQRPPYALAAKTLRDLESLGRNVPAFHVLSAELALKLSQVAEATTHFEQAARLEPTNQLHRFNLAVLGLQSTNEATRRAASLSLEDLSTNRELSHLAIRWRVADSLQRNDLQGALRISAQLLVDPRSGLQDRLQHLRILQLSQNPSFPLYLRGVQERAATNAVDIYSTSEWMGSHGLANEAIHWLLRFDPKQRERQPMPLALANLYLVKEDWASLENFLAGQKWRDLEFLRVGLLARAASGQQQNVAADARWHAAVDATAGRLGPLALLLGLANDWGRDPEDVLWEIGRRFPREDWAFLELEKRYLIAGNTRGLNKLYNTRLSSQPGASDATNRNNFATSSLLLKVNLSQAHETARDLYRQRPEDPVVGSTYAYSLHLQGRTEEGLTVLARFKPQALELPSIALYYGVLLSSSGRTGQATRYLALAEKALLLPEEQELLAEAKRCLR